MWLLIHTLARKAARLIHHEINISSAICQQEINNHENRAGPHCKTIVSSCLGVRKVAKNDLITILAALFVIILGVPVVKPNLKMSFVVFVVKRHNGGRMVCRVYLKRILTSKRSFV